MMRRPVGLVLLASLAIVACRPSATAGDARLSGTFAGGWRFPELRAPVVGDNAMISSNSAIASGAGVEILKAGGNAVDAAVAVGFSLAVTFPFAGNIGGGGFMVIRMADGRTGTLDYREVAPLAATRNMYVDSTGKLTGRQLTGHLASGVPGAVAGMHEALQKYGTKTLAEVMAPAIRLAREGFAVDSNLYRSLRGAQQRLCQYEGCSTFYPNGTAPTPGTTLLQPDLARSLQLIAEQGPKAFYDGPVAEVLVAEMQRGAGIITREDLRRYEPRWREPVLSTYRGYTLITMPPASSGGITMTETFNILEKFAPLPPFGSPEYIHLLSEAFRRAFMDRNVKLADPDFVPVPRAQLVSKAYADTLASTINRRRATRTPQFETGAEPEHTTHYSVVDAVGNAVATTTTLNGGYGSAVWVRDGGFFMNNEMDDFAAQPGTANMFGLVQGEANAIQPGKRMLSAMSPTIVLDREGKVLLVVGAAGGPTIITATSQVILNVIEFGMSLTEAMRAPRVHHQALPDAIRHETVGFSELTLRRLRRMGHVLTPQEGIANVNAVMRSGAVWHGVHEPRSAGGAAGY